MPAHRIRLREAWEYQIRLGDEHAMRRIRLPTRWESGLKCPILLVRAFGRPTVDPDLETIALELNAVPGLVSIRLNERELLATGLGRMSHHIPLEFPLLPRNTLRLEVAALPHQTIGVDWGEVALLISPRGPVE